MNTEPPAPVTPVVDPRARHKAREFTIKVTITGAGKVVGKETVTTTGHGLTAAARDAAARVAGPIETAWRNEHWRPL